MAYCRFIRMCLLWLSVLVPCHLVYADSYFVSPDGSNSQSGTESSPFKTVSKALSRVDAGDTIVISDGIYREKLNIRESGSAGNYITISAKNPGRVTIDASDSGPAMIIKEQSYIKIDGLKFISASDSSTVVISSRDGQSRENLPTNNIILNNVSIQGNCIDSNCAAFGIARASHIEINNAWVYGMGRYTFLIYGSSHVNANRLVLRSDGWRGKKYKKNDPRFALGIYNSFENKLSNLVIMDGRQRPKNTRGDLGGIKIAGGNNGKTAPWFSSDQNIIDGFIITDTHGAAISIESRQEPHKTNSIKNGFIINNDGGIVLNKKVKDTTFDSLFIINNKHLSLANFSQRAVGTRMLNSTIDSNKGSKGITGKGKIELSNTTHLRGGTSTARNTSLHTSTLSTLHDWPYTDAIKRDMCDQTLLSTVKRLKNELPRFCGSDKSFADYLISRIP